MPLPLFLLALEASFAVALPSDGSGGPPGSSSGGYPGTPNGEYNSRSVRVYHSYNSGSSEPLSKGAMIALIVILSVFGVMILVITVFFVALKLKLRKLNRANKEALIPEKQTLTSSDRASFEELSSSSYNIGHTQGSRAGNGQEGARGGSRGGGAPVVWNARASTTISHGMSDAPQRDRPENDEMAGKPLASSSMPVPNPT